MPHLPRPSYATYIYVHDLMLGVRITSEKSILGNTNKLMLTTVSLTTIVIVLKNFSLTLESLSVEREPHTQLLRSIHSSRSYMHLINTNKTFFQRRTSGLYRIRMVRFHKHEMAILRVLFIIKCTYLVDTRRR